MLLNSYTKELQDALADYSRSGLENDKLKTDQKRLSQYHRLVRNVVNDTLIQAYPITFKLLSSEDWINMVDDFLKNKKENNPQIWKMPKDFLNYARDNKWDKKFNRPYLIDLLQFEWLEIEVHTMPDQIPDKYNSDGNLMEDIIVVNPEMRIARFDYPVHKIKIWGKDDLPKGDYFLIIFREPNTGLVKFIEIPMIFTVLIEMIVKEEKPVVKILNDLSEIFNISDYDEFYNKTNAFINDMKEMKVFLGVKK